MVCNNVRGLVLVLWAGLLATNLGFAQVEEMVTGPSPDAAVLSEMGRAPVSQYTGTANIQIPIYRFERTKIPFSISLAYSTTGVRVSDVPGIAGLGWALNAGGVISRTVRGFPDETLVETNAAPIIPKGYWKNKGFVDGYPALSSSIKDHIVNGKIDAQADIFHYNFNGYGGDFVIEANSNGDPVRVWPIPYNNIEFELEIETVTQPVSGETDRVIKKFVATTPDGIKYFFEAFETTLTETSTCSEGAIIGGGTIQNEDPMRTAWYLTKVEAPFTRDVIKLNYDNASYEDPHPSTYSEILWHAPAPNGCSVAFGIRQRTKTYREMVTKQIREILLTTTSPGGVEYVREKVEFDLGSRTDLPDQKRIDAIRVYVDGTLSRSFDFSYGYMPAASGNTQTRLMLRQIQERPASPLVNGGGLPLPYVFEYYDFDFDDPNGTTYKLPDFDSNNVDYWGFFNNGDNEDLYFSSGCPDDGTLLVDGPGTEWADREPHEYAMQTGVLRKVRYPTGGDTEMWFEPHSYISLGNNLPSGQYEGPGSSGIAGGLRVKRIISHDEVSNNEIIKEYNYSVGKLFSFPQYAYDVDIGGCVRMFSFSMSPATLGVSVGTHVGYGVVTEYLGGRVEGSTSNCAIFLDCHGEDGKIEYRYNIANFDDEYLKDNPVDIFPSFPITGTSNAQHRGMIAEENYFDSENTEIRRIEYAYDHGMSPVASLTCLNRSQYGADFGELNPGDFINPYQVESLWIPLVETTETEIIDGKELVKVTGFTYDHDIQPGTAISKSDLNIKRKDETLFDGQQYRTVFQYPNDYGCEPTNTPCSDPVSPSDDHAAAILAMKNTHHMHDYPIETQVYKKIGGAYQLISGEVKKYKTYSNIGLLLNFKYVLEIDEPDVLFSSSGGSYITSSGNSFLLNNSNYKLKYELVYDSYGNIETIIIPKQGKEVSFDWDGSRALLLSETKTALDGSLTPATTTYAYSLPGHSVLTSTTDPNGKVTTYDYDKLGRLTGVAYQGQPEKTFEYHYGGRLGGSFSYERNYLATTHYGTLTNVDYFGGLGHKVQSVAVEQSPDLRDIVTSHEYVDGYKIRDYLPYEAWGTAGSYRLLPGAFYDQMDYYSAGSLEGVDATGRPFTDYLFESSPNKRLLGEAPPGEAWVPSSWSGSSRAITYQYGVYLDNATSMAYMRNTRRDENHNRASEILDGLGRIIIKTDAQDVETQYIYDDLGNLDEVVSPAGVFDYTYDARKRLIAKGIPGKEVEYFVYDPLDRLVLTQTGNLRENDQWIYTKYDAFDRVVQTGIYHSPEDRETLQNLINSYAYAAFSSFPNSDIEELTNTEWDDFYLGLVSCKRTKILDAFDNVAPDELETCFEYDERYRLTKETGQNHLGGTDVIEYAYNNFGLVTDSRHQHHTPYFSYNLDKVKAYDHANRLTSITNNGQQSAAIRYNGIGMLVEKNLHQTALGHLQSIDYGYTPRAWLKSINVIDDLTANDNDLFAMELYYDQPYSAGAQYNGNISDIRWKTATDGVDRIYGFYYDQLDRLYHASWPGNAYSVWLNYDEAGNITNLFRSALLSGVPASMDDLHYHYDSNAHLVAVDDNVGPMPDIPNDFEDNGQSYANSAEEEYGYDPNGNMVWDLNKGIGVEYNILNLPQKIMFENGRSIIWVYAADGTKLQKRVCKPGKPDAHYKIKADSVSTYIDEDKHYTARYAGVNSIRTAATAGMDHLQHYRFMVDRIETIKGTPWAPQGVYVKPEGLERVSYESCDVRDYIGNVEYFGQQPEAYYTEEGRINLATNPYRHEYAIKDHLGNARVHFADLDGEGIPSILQETHYYPFGLRMHELSQTYEYPENKYQFQGQEVIDDMGLATISFKWRMHDPAIGRFWQIDPLAEKFYYNSLYAFSENKVTSHVELEGLEAVDPYTGVVHDNSDVPPPSLVMIEVERIYENENSTVSTLDIDNGIVTGYILEEDAGAPGDETTSGSDARISEGTYEVNEYSSYRFPDNYELEGVEGRSHILIHAENTPEHTEGCLLPGCTYSPEINPDFVGSSREVMNEIRMHVRGVQRRDRESGATSDTRIFIRISSPPSPWSVQTQHMTPD